MSQIRRVNLIKKREDFLAADDPIYVKFKLSAGIISSFQISWHDATTAFAATFYTSNWDDPPVPANGAAGPSAEYWHDESSDVTIPTVTAGAVGCDLFHLGNNGAKWGLLKIAPTANSNLSILTHEKD